MSNLTLYILWLILCLMVGSWYGWYGWEWKWGKWKSVLVACATIGVFYLMIYIVPNLIYGVPL